MNDIIVGAGFIGCVIGAYVLGFARGYSKGKGFIE